MQAKNKKRVNLYLDGRFACGLEAITVLKYNLQVGQEIDDDRLNEICLDSETSTAFDKAIRHLEFRIHSQKEMEVFLSQKGFLPIVIDTVIAKLKDYKYIDDQAFATQFVSSYQKKFGRDRLRYELQNRGISTDIIDTVTDDLDSSETINNLIQKKYKGDKRKLIDFLARRGFDYDTILPLVEKFLKDLKDTEQS